jgi:hypothetical protein
MSSGPEGEKVPSQSGRIYDCICSDSCLIQEPLAVAGVSIYDNAELGKSGCEFDNALARPPSAPSAGGAPFRALSILDQGQRANRE